MFESPSRAGAGGREGGRRGGGRRVMKNQEARSRKQEGKAADVILLNLAGCFGQTFQGFLVNLPGLFGEPSGSFWQGPRAAARKTFRGVLVNLPDGFG